MRLQHWWLRPCRRICDEMNLKSRKDELKAKYERDSFVNFLQAVGWPIDELNIESRLSPEPDILYTLGAESCAFELLSVTQSEFVQPLVNAQIVYPGPTTLRENLKKKLKGNYASQFPIELIIHYRISMSTTDVVLLDTQEVLWDSNHDRFRRIWYFGENNRLFLFHKNWWSEVIKSETFNFLGDTKPKEKLAF
jgi:hypothetical protein